jgi:hypothetical protein
MARVEGLVLVRVALALEVGAGLCQGDVCGYWVGCARL